MPCGHCFHQDCFREWEASRGRNVVTCPMCNGETNLFTNLFLNLDSQDDGDSLSSTSSCATEERTAQESGRRTEESVPHEIDPPDVIEIDDNSVVELLSNLPSLPRQPRGQRPQVPKHARDEPALDEDTCRLRRKAKRVKMRNKFLEAKSNEIVERERKLLEDFSKTRQRLEVIEQESERREDEAKSLQRELEHSKLMLVRLRRERDAAQEQVNSVCERLHFMCEKVTKAEEDLNSIHQSYQEQLKKAGARAMKEVQELLDRHPKLVQENHNLKEVMVNKDQSIQALKKKVNSLEEILYGRVDEDVREHLSRGKKNASQVAKRYQEAQEEERLRREQEKLQQERRKESQSETVGRLSGKNSAHAARIASAALHIASKPKRPMDVLDSVPHVRTSAKATQKRKGNSSDTSENGGSFLLGMSLNVSSAKKRMIEPFPRKGSATQIVKRGGKNTDIRQHFQTG